MSHNPSIPPIVFADVECRAFRARPKQDTWDWATKNIRMTEGPLRGHLWSPDATPHARGIMRAFDDPHVRKLYFLAPSQSGKTTICFLCFFSAQHARPDNWGIGMPDKEAVEATFQAKLHKYFSANPALKKMLLPDPNALQSKEILLADGSRIMGMWAGSEGSMRSKPMPYILADEPDAYADPAALNTMQERADAYQALELSKIFIACRPKGTEEQSVTWTDAKRQAQAWMRYVAVCPACGKAQTMEHDNIVAIDGTHDPKRIRQEKLARYKCESCGYLWNDHMRNAAIRAGHWADDMTPDGEVPTPDDYHGATIVAYHFRSWESPLVSMSDVLADWFEAQGNPRLLQLFDNNRCAKPYRFVQVEMDHQRLARRINAELPQGIVPDWALAVTCAIDVQLDHFYWSVAAHGLSPTRLHILDYGRVERWEEVTQVVFDSRYARQDGRVMAPWRAALDTGGGRDKPYEDTRTMQAYEWLLRQRPGVVFGTKGMSRKTPGQLVDRRSKDQLPDGRKIRSGFNLHFIDTDSFKRYAFWALEEGCEDEPITFHGQADEGYLKQIASERLVQGKDGSESWKKFRDNHYLDCLVLHAAMAWWQWKPSLAQLTAGTAETPEVRVNGMFNGQGLFG